MKYIIINDLSYILRKKYKIILAYIFTYILYFYLIKNAYIETNLYSLLNNVLATKISYNLLISDPFNASMLLLNCGLFMFLSISIYIKDMDNYDNLSFRISIKKWILCKTIVMLIICSLVNFIIYFNVYVNNVIGIKYFIILIKKIFMLMTLLSASYLVMILFNKLRILSLILLVIIIIIFFLGFDVEKINIIYSLIGMIISLLLLAKSSKKIKFSDLKE